MFANLFVKTKLSANVLYLFEVFAVCLLASLIPSLSTTTSTSRIPTLTPYSSSSTSSRSLSPSFIPTSSSNTKSSSGSTVGVRVKYESCYALSSQYFKTSGQSVTYDGCPSKVHCDDISDDLYETVDKNNPLIIDRHGFPSKTLTVGGTSYHPDIECLKDGSTALRKDYFYDFNYDHDDSANCGCSWTSIYTFACYDCYRWFCTEAQPLLCYEPDGTPSPTPQPTTPEVNTKNDFCDRDYSVSITNGETICGMVGLNDLDQVTNSNLFGNIDLKVDELKSILLWKKKQHYLLIIYMNSTQNAIFADIFDENGDNIIANHLVVEIDKKSSSDKLDDVQIINKQLISGDFTDSNNEYQNTSDFMVLYHRDDMVQYTLCQFTGDLIINIHQNGNFTPSPEFTEYNEYPHDFSVSYLFNADSFILFGRDSSYDLSVIIFNLNGDLLNEDKINFVISDYYDIKKLSCGFNSTHDICLLNYVYDSYSSYGSIIAITLSSDTQTAHITFINDRFDINDNQYYQQDLSNKPVIISPNYDKFWMLMSGNPAATGSTIYLSATVYNLYGDTIVNQFVVTERDVSSKTACYSTYQSGIILCTELFGAADMFLFNVNGDALIDGVGTLLSEDTLNSYIQRTHPETYSYFGDIINIYNFQLVPLTSNDFWVVFAAEINIDAQEKDIILATKMSVYDECCDIYTLSSDMDDDNDNDDDDDDGGLDVASVVSIGDVKISVGALVGIIIGGVALLCIIIIAVLWCSKRRKQNKPNKPNDKITYEVVATDHELVTNK